MSFLFSTLFPYLLIGIALLLLFAAFRFRYKTKFAETLLTLPEAARERFLKNEKKIVTLLKISLWPVLILLIVFPLGMYLFDREYFRAATVYMALFSITILQEYRFCKWLINYLEAKAISK